MNKYMISIFKRMPIADLQNESSNEKLSRHLGPWSLILLGIGVIIGAGIFSLTGYVAATYAGPAVILSFVISAIACALAGLCYAEFSAMVPIAGSAYTYTYATMGGLAAWIIGWDLVLEYAVAAATVAISWSQYLNQFLASFGLALPTYLVASPSEGGLLNLPAMLMVFAISLLLIRGIKASAMVNAVLVLLKLSVILVIIAFGWAYINPDFFDPFIPPNTGRFGEFGWSGVLRGSSIIFFAFLGFDAISTTAQEVRNPQRNLPIGIIASLVVCTFLYVLFSCALVGLVHYKDLAGTGINLSAVGIALERLPLGASFKPGILIAILAGYISVVMVQLLAQSRIFYAMGRDGLVPSLFASLHPRYKTPWKSNLFFGLFAGLVAAFVPAHIVGELTSIGALMAFSMVCLGVIILRRTMPDQPRPFKVPLYPIVPILGILMCITMMLSLPPETWWRLVIWLGVGLVLFFSYSIKNIKQI